MAQSFLIIFRGNVHLLILGVNVKMTAGSAEQVKPGDLASGARRTESWYKEAHVTTIKRGGGARKNTRARESEEHTRARELDFVVVFLLDYRGRSCQRWR